MSPLATWQGPFDCFLPNLTTLRVGEQHEVSDEDLKSAHWQPVGPAAPAPSPLVISSTSSTPSAPSQTSTGEAD